MVVVLAIHKGRKEKGKTKVESHTRNSTLWLPPYMVLSPLYCTMRTQLMETGETNKKPNHLGHSIEPRVVQMGFHLTRNK